MSYLTNNHAYDADEVYGRLHNDKVFGPKSERFRRALSKQLFDSAWTIDMDSDERSEARIGALEAWEAFEPQDASEAFLVALMVMNFQAAAGRMRLAAQTLNPDECDRAMKSANQLMGMYGQQLTTLDRHRGKGQQRITVERVAVVESGRQAIVGNIEMPALAAIPQPGRGSGVDPKLTAPSRVRSRIRRADD